MSLAVPDTTRRTCTTSPTRRASARAAPTIPVPQAACGTDFQNFGIKRGARRPSIRTPSTASRSAPRTTSTIAFKIASSIYYIRWNNIQQTVVPPICQISFITNLGQAVAKGADIQAEIARDRRLHGRIVRRLHRRPLHRRTRSFAHRDPAHRLRTAMPSSARAASPRRRSPRPSDSNTSSRLFEPRCVRAGGRRVSGRAQVARRDPGSRHPAVRFGQLHAVLDQFRLGARRHELRRPAGRGIRRQPHRSHTITNYDWSIDPQVAGTSRLQREFTFRPRTIGLTFIYRSNEPIAHSASPAPQMGGARRSQRLVRRIWARLQERVVAHALCAMLLSIANRVI